MEKVCLHFIKAYMSVLWRQEVTLDIYATENNIVWNLLKVPTP